jgi:hypothetical protein
MVRGVETESRNIAKSANSLAAEPSTQRIATIFYEPQVVFSRESPLRLNIKN